MYIHFMQKILWMVFTGATVVNAAWLMWFGDFMPHEQTPGKLIGCVLVALAAIALKDWPEEDEDEDEEG